MRSRRPWQVDRNHLTTVYDIHATILHQLGIDHKRLTYRFQGRPRLPPNRRARERGEGHPRLTGLIAGSLRGEVRNSVRKKRLA